MSASCALVDTQTYSIMLVLALVLRELLQTLGVATHDAFELDKPTASALETPGALRDPACLVDLKTSVGKLLVAEVI